jgi:hypothetical protein
VRVRGGGEFRMSKGVRRFGRGGLERRSALFFARSSSSLGRFRFFFVASKAYHWCADAVRVPRALGTGTEDEAGISG